MPGGNVPVGRAGEDRLIQDRLGQFLVAGVAESVFQVVDRLALDPVEIFLAESGREDRLDQQRIVFRQVVLVDAAGNDRHLDRGRSRVTAGQRKQPFKDRLVAVLLRRALR